MRLIDAQRRLRERGRIRLGYSTPSTKRAGVKVPHKLESFRFTADDQATIEQVAAIYGGAPERWPDGPDAWQVTTPAKEVSVVFATEVAFSQSYEQWTGGFLQRLCDGEQALVPSTGTRMRKEPCACEPDERTCQMTTHLKLILPELPGLGTWRLVTHGYNAGVELLAAVELIEGALGAGLVRVPARLLVEKRERRRLVVQDDGSAKPMVMKFAVPVLELEGSVAALGPGTTSTGSATPLSPGAAAALATGTQVSLPAGPPPTGWKPVEQAALPEAPEVPMTERLEVAEPKKRRNSAPALPATGRRPRTGAQAEAAETCSGCGQPYAGEPVVRNPEPDGSRYVHRACAERAEVPGGAALDGADAPGNGGEGGDAPSEPPAGGAGEATGTAEPTPPAPARTPGAKRAESAIAKAAARSGPARMMSHAQHAKVMALTAKALPKLEGETQDDCDQRRRTEVLAMCAALGQPGLESRTGITAVTAGPLIEGLTGVEEGRLAWDGASFVVAEGAP